MKKYTVDKTTTLEVAFSDEKLAKEFFIEGDWGESFWTFDTLRDMCEHFLENYHSCVTQFGTAIDYEGFGYFKYDNTVEGFVSDEPEHYGSITIKVEEY